jgi:signal transduction histidine kinase
MTIADIWTEIEAVPITASMHAVFEQFCAHRDWPFLPVVDAQQHVVGVVREYDLKGHAYAQFGRDLVKRYAVRDFLKPALVLSVKISEKELLDASAKQPNPDGIVLTDGGKYRAVLLNGAVLRLFEQQHLDNEVRLAQAQKMEAIGTLAGGIAHDLNNILTPILGYAEFMSDLLKQGEPIEQDMMDQIVVSARRARDTVKQILAFSRHQNSERCPLRLGALVKETIPLIRSLLPATIDIEMRLQDDEDTVMANPDELHRVVLNLCTNANHARPHRRGTHAGNFADPSRPARDFVHGLQRSGLARASA